MSSKSDSPPNKDLGERLVEMFSDMLYDLCSDAFAAARPPEERSTVYAHQ